MGNESIRTGRAITLCVCTGEGTHVAIQCAQAHYANPGGENHLNSSRVKAGVGSGCCFLVGWCRVGVAMRGVTIGTHSLVSQVHNINCRWRLAKPHRRLVGSNNLCSVLKAIHLRLPKGDSGPPADQKSETNKSWRQQSRGRRENEPYWATGTLLL